jgi:ADP-ribose pyrophosphatase YjhB (NUDIX family)
MDIPVYYFRSARLDGFISKEEITLMNEALIQFCILCGTRVNQEEKFGRLRPVCPSCGWIYFTDPKVAAAVVIIQNGRVLLTRRINEPFQGYWTLPAGFMDAGENPEETARRECLEETGLQVKITGLADLISGREHQHGADLVIVYEAEITGGILQAGDDADQVAFFPLNDLPALAFAATQKTLQKLHQTLE